MVEDSSLIDPEFLFGEGTLIIWITVGLAVLQILLGWGMTAAISR